jgi:hypothetical protein
MPCHHATTPSRGATDVKRSAQHVARNRVLRSAVASSWSLVRSRRSVHSRPSRVVIAERSERANLREAESTLVVSDEGQRQRDGRRRRGGRQLRRR